MPGIDRIVAIRRLFLSKLNKMPSDMPHNERVECARKELDKVLGPLWREEVEEAGHELDPTGESYTGLDKLKQATKDEGFSGDDVQPADKKTLIKVVLKHFGKR